MTRTLSLIIPVYNEAPHLEQLLTIIDRLELPVAKELVIVDDHSTDGSAQIIQNFSFRSQTVFISQARNQGKGAALRIGIREATGDLIGMETCYKFFRADVIKNIKLESNRFGFEPEVTAKIARLRLRVMELPISYFPRQYLEGKKMNWKDGLAAIMHIIYYNLLRKRAHCFLETMPPRYLSSKGSRL